MRPLLLALTLLTAAGAARAETVQPQETVAVRIAGLSPAEARAAVRAAVDRVCRAADLDDLTGPTNCYNVTLRAALDDLKKAERAPNAREVQTAAR